MFIKLKVHPGSKEDKIIKKGNDSFEAWVRAPAERGLANCAALGLLGKALGGQGTGMRIVKGSHSSSKIVQLIQYDREAGHIGVDGRRSRRD